MNEQIKRMEAEKAKLQERVKKLDEAISALQAVCDHNFLYDGHDSHYEYHKCHNCGMVSKT